MKDIREVTQAALDAVFFDMVPVYAEDSEVDRLPEEYIVHDVVYSVPDDWANGKILTVREGVDVSYCCRLRSQKTVRLRQITEAMLAAGYLLVDGFSDLPRGEQTGYYGATAEFVLYRTVGADVVG